VAGTAVWPAVAEAVGAASDADGPDGYASTVTDGIVVACGVARDAATASRVADALTPGGRTEAGPAPAPTVSVSTTNVALVASQGARARGRREGKGITSIEWSVGASAEMASLAEPRVATATRPPQGVMSLPEMVTLVEPLVVTSWPELSGWVLLVTVTPSTSVKRMAGPAIGTLLTLPLMVNERRT
jgi:hypothetical protein